MVPGAPAIHPTSSCSSAWGWVLLQSSSSSVSHHPRSPSSVVPPPFVVCSSSPHHSSSIPGRPTVTHPTASGLLGLGRVVRRCFCCRPPPSPCRSWSFVVRRPPARHLSFVVVPAVVRGIPVCRRRRRPLVFVVPSLSPVVFVPSLSFVGLSWLGGRRDVADVWAGGAYPGGFPDYRSPGADVHPCHRRRSHGAQQPGRGWGWAVLGCNTT
jgi:hypothetical protein